MSRYYRSTRRGGVVHRVDVWLVGPPVRIRYENVAILDRKNVADEILGF